MTRQITAYETKTKQAEIFRRAAAGEIFVVTNNGKPQVEIRAAEAATQEEIANALQTLEKIQAEQCEKTGRIDLRALIEEGRD